MKVYIEKTKETVDYPKSCTGLELLRELKINPQTVLIIQNGSVVLEDVTLDTNDEIKLLSVVSGG